MRFLLSIAAFILMISACKNVTGGQQDKLFDEVMQLHDEIMPGTTNLGKLQGPLKSLLATPDSIPKGFTKDDVIETSMHVEKAYNDMMDWMRDFKLPENMNPSDKISYLQAEKSKLLKMKDETNSAYNEASAIIKGSK